MTVRSQNSVSVNSYPNNIRQTSHAEYPHFPENWQATAAKLPPSELTAKIAEAMGDRYSVRFSQPGNPIQDQVEKLCNHSALNGLQKMLLSSSYDTTMRKLKEQGVSLESQDPVLIMQQIVRLASRFEQNLSGESSTIMKIAQRECGGNNDS